MTSNLLFPILFAVFAVQLVLCLISKRRMIKLIPTILVGACEVICILSVVAAGLVGSKAGWVYDAAFGGTIYAILLAIFLAGDAFAWAIYGIVKLVQKRRK